LEGISTQKQGEREGEEEGKEKERNLKDSKKQRRENVSNGDKREEMDDYEWRNKAR